MQNNIRSQENNPSTSSVALRPQTDATDAIPGNVNTSKEGISDDNYETDLFDRFAERCFFRCITIPLMLASDFYYVWMFLDITAISGKVTLFPEIRSVEDISAAYAVLFCYMIMAVMLFIPCLAANAVVLWDFAATEDEKAALVIQYCFKELQQSSDGKKIYYIGRIKKYRRDQNKRFTKNIQEFLSQLKEDEMLTVRKKNGIGDGEGEVVFTINYGDDTEENITIDQEHASYFGMLIFHRHQEHGVDVWKSKEPCNQEDLAASLNEHQAFEEFLRSFSPVARGIADSLRGNQCFPRDSRYHQWSNIAMKMEGMLVHMDLQPKKNKEEAVARLR